MFPKIRGTPKWMVYCLENPMNKWMIWGFSHYFWVDTHMYFCSCYAAIQSSPYSKSLMPSPESQVVFAGFYLFVWYQACSMTTIMASRNALVFFFYGRVFFRFGFLVDICRWYIIRYDEQLGELVSNLLYSKHTEHLCRHMELSALEIQEGLWKRAEVKTLKNSIRKW